MFFDDFRRFHTPNAGIQGGEHTLKIDMKKPRNIDFSILQGSSSWSPQSESN